MPENHNTAMGHLTLGQVTDYPEHFDANLLHPVPRALNREEIELRDDALPFEGVDLWTGYELSWLQPSGVPAVAILEVEVPVTSPNLIESKSFKLYLNGFNQTTFPSTEAVQHQLQTDLSACAGVPVAVRIYSLDAYTARSIHHWESQCIDQAPLTVSTYDYAPELLQNICDPSGQVTTEQLHSHLLKSNCLITNQPDWGSVYIHYQGPKLNPSVLLAYLISFRSHNEFHEQCVERIYTDLMKYAKCESLLVLARYTRRGGLDINPLRYSHGQNLVLDPELLLRRRLVRQ
ncbi:NADPH-dependent 7-cyano-7-deazaguanine reductase QueF [Aliidiomarina sanyensis]|uniref:NADPH-dependent 7-cyano-7-deazaguanine reductase n=1 Tax=Aliidiomarina sanyensis TaxID=1249555 RepID=A0A432WR66_9GAMM|nr:NADPH-dependent 7-cyano-7-deazaguanine reductase QueF [Aliidiomarina sanyensis]RUO36302.1 NADPH-dependent 7-cyano-7-deazaguanine reductase QueF [Aliidiomarina sanyensis]